VLAAAQSWGRPSGSMVARVANSAESNQALAASESVVVMSSILTSAVRRHTGLPR